MNAMLRWQLVRQEDLRRVNVQRRRLRDAMDPLDIPESQFIQYYRVNQELFLVLLDKIRGYIPQSVRKTKICIEIKVLAALSFFATGSYQKIIGRDLHVSLSQTCISRCVHEVVAALNRLFPEVIQYPSTQSARAEIKQEFFRNYGLPGVVGCIDGTHIAIIRPIEREDAYFNRKGYHSINATMICDANLKILAVNAQFGGNAHDSHVWNNMSIRTFIENVYNGGERGWLLGDSAYAQRPWLMTPILHVEENTPEFYYTSIHAKARSCIERCFGVLKSRWRCLSKHRVLNYTPEFSARIIQACCVLHNICIEAHLDLSENIEVIDEDNNFHNINERTDNLELGRTERNQLVMSLWNSRHTNQLH